MNKPAASANARISIGVSLVVNLLFSWMALPFLLPPFHVYSLRDLIDVLLWQAIGTVGWPLAFFGGIFSLLLQPRSTDLGALLMLLVYPAMLLLLILVLRSRRPKWWVIILLHAVIAFSFAAVWHGVLQGTGFMVG